MRIPLLAAGAAVLLLAGCVQPATDTKSLPAGAGLPDLPLGSSLAVGPGEGLPLLAGPALWPDPQNAPHPGWTWPTLSNPPSQANTPGWWLPFNATELPARITGLAHVAQAGNISFGAGIAVFGSLVFVPGEGSGSWLVDVREPAKPVVLSHLDSAGRGAAFIPYPNGRLVVASATTPGFDVIDATDPLNPEILNQTVVPKQWPGVPGGHKVGVVPGTPILYNAGSVGGEPVVSAGPVNKAHPVFGPGRCNVDISQCTGYTEIYDLTDPEHPRFVQNFQNGLSCHHIFFWNAPDGSRSRAICAGIQYTQLWDTADPLDPKVLVSIPVHHGVPGTPSGMASIAAFSHSAGLNIRGDILYVGDESNGGGDPPGCVASVDVPGLGAVAVPVGATWFYDVSAETDPKLLGYYSAGIGPGTYVNSLPTPQDPTPPLTATSCTSHHGRIVPEEGRDLLAMSFYGDGVVLLDFTGISAGTLPKVVDRFAQSSNTWETWYAGGHLFTGDMSRGMDVFAFR